MNETLSRFLNLAGVILISIFAFSLVETLSKKYNLNKYPFYYVLLLSTGVVLVMISNYEPNNLDEKEEYF